MSGERDIEFLLDLYNNSYVKGESRSNETLKKIRDDGKRKNRHLLLDGLINEMRPLHLNPNQIKIVRYLIDDFNDDFNNLHRQASDETIILAFIFYLKKIENPSIRLEDYRICTKYELNNHIFELIVCRMLLKFMKRCPILPCKNYSKDNHEILIREGKR